MASLYANENFPLPAVEKLRELRHDVQTVAETGKAEQAWPDKAVLEFATANNRALLTLNRKHFIKLHRDNPKHAGIVACTLDRDFAALAERIDAALSEHPSLTGQLIRIINRPGPA